MDKLRGLYGLVDRSWLFPLTFTGIGIAINSMGVFLKSVP